MNQDTKNLIGGILITVGIGLIFTDSLGMVGNNVGILVDIIGWVFLLLK
jgi:hypothetical protein